MRLTSFTDYSVRVLTYAALKKNELASIREVSEVYGISSNHLMKVIHHLGKGNYLETIRGKNGGFRLARDPKDISIGELIRYTEDDLALINSNAKNTDQNEKVSFNAIVEQALGSFIATVDNYTLADLVEGQTLTNFLD
ncbi:Rrf2 family transcriptional regulator [Emcibacteraceae bacterium]|jgi:Rrf2 family nitric oxide-sensitive transcriptional repressor|uniref:Rrf2 family transcriptional regulator n=1 Tax=Pseudemcibacter sp. TaxID=2943293 RepID=UPI002312C40B|nr:Rrf2 family transcriptional regulator [Kordiimonadaceae bacterium]MDA7569016.1 Rrf2 family transcriptional regulator [Emcibacteraceae bacterium]MDA9771235.1 Rrf2 family transcriptional regulator [Emcibacteraceae bacterium]MDC1090348.1 Rrf2 family transcriptional regulator [Emcibacteraceae bacterium]